MKFPDNTAVVRCMRVADSNDPVPGSSVDECAGCHQPIWVSPGIVAEVRSLRPLDTVVLVCLHCPVDVDEDGGVMLPPGQLEMFVAAGYDPRDMAALVAAGAVLDRHQEAPTPTAIIKFLDQVRRDPLTSDAAEFRRELTRVMGQLSVNDRRN